MERKSFPSTDSAKRIFFKRLIPPLVILWAFLLSPEARADRKIFAFPYPYTTMPKGGFEIEHYLDLKLAEYDDPKTSEKEKGFAPAWDQQFEFEYGITDHLDFGFYNVFRQEAYDSLKYRGPKLRFMYRFGERDDFFIDPAIYLEGAYFGEEYELEQRIILSKVIGAVETSLNLKFEEEFERENGETEFEFVFNPTFGVGYHFSEAFVLGVEYFGHMEVVEGEMEHFAHFVGPSISLAGSHFYWVLTFQPQITSEREEHPNFQARSIFGIIF
ncbi:MAG: hypothetical protein Kow0090_00800 [Myxococcota bacterium]